MKVGLPLLTCGLWGAHLTTVSSHLVFVHEILPDKHKDFGPYHFYQNYKVTTTCGAHFMLAIAVHSGDTWGGLICLYNGTLWKYHSKIPQKLIIEALLNSIKNVIGPPAWCRESNQCGNTDASLLLAFCFKQKWPTGMKLEKNIWAIYWLLSLSAMWVPPFEKMGFYQHPLHLFIMDVSQTGVYLQAWDTKEMMAAIQR